MNNEQQISRLLDFMRTIGRLLSKTIILAPENAPWVPLWRFEPNQDEEEWFLKAVD